MDNFIKVLVVDDHETILDAIKQFADLQQNYDIRITHTAGSEQEALNMLQDQNFDVAVIDMRLPRIRNEPNDSEAGLRIVKVIKMQFPTTKILAISGELYKPEFILRVIRNGADGYVLKRAARLDQIIDAIRQVCRGEKVYPSEVIHFFVNNDPTAAQLSDREQEIWQLITDGLTNREIAQQLFISLDTVKRCTSEIYSKIGVTNRAQATRKWLEKQYGLVESGKTIG